MVPPLELRLAELHQHVRERDITWLRDRRAAGELSWLMPHIGEADYRDLGRAIDSGDMDLVDRRLAVLGDGTTVISEPVTRITTVGSPLDPTVPLSRVTGDPLTNDLDDPTLLVSRGGAVLPASAVRRERNTLVIVGILIAVVAAAIVAFLLLRNNDDNVDTVVVAPDTSVPATIASESTTAAAVETIAVAETLPSASLPPASPVPSSAPVPTVTAAPAGASGTVSPATSPSNIPATVPAAAAPLADVIATAQRSSTFGPYLTMIEAAGLTGEFMTMKNVTILAPTESAFTALAPDLQIALRSPSNRTVLARIVRYSILNQARMAAQLTPGTYPTVEGSPIGIQTVNGGIRINDATVTGPDIKVSNGVLHAVDRLLIPPTVDLNSLVPKSGTPTAAPTTPVAPQTTAAPPTAPPPTTPASTPATVVPATPAPTSAATTAAPATTVAPASSAPTTRATTVVPTTTLVTTTAAPTTRPAGTTIP